MSELRSVIETLRTEVVSQLPDARVEQDFAELQAACEALEAERLRRLAEIDRRRLFERDGHLSAASWLVARHCVTWGEARRAVVIARALERMPIVRGFDAGAVSLSAARTLVDAHDAGPRRSKSQSASSSRRRCATPFPTSGGSRCIGVTSWSASGPDPTASRPLFGVVVGCTRRSRSRAWCASTATSIPRAAKRS